MCVSTQTSPKPQSTSPINGARARRIGRHAAAACALALLAVAAPTTAYAVPAEGWPVAPEVSGLQILVLVLLIPLGLAIVLGLAVSLPGLAAGRSQKSGSNVPATWMGGPKEGTDTLPEGSSASDDTGSDARGGSSGSW